MIPQNRQRLPRPIPLGISGAAITEYQPGFCCGGTLGALLTKNGKFFILSNKHVIALDITPGENGRVRQVGDPIYQPAGIDNNCQRPEGDRVAELSQWAPIFSDRSNLMDAAIAEIVSGRVRISGSVFGIGVPDPRPHRPFLNTLVMKSGRSSGITYGSISGVKANVRVTYSYECGNGTGFTALFHDQILIKPNTVRNADFSMPGDSGSLVLTSATKVPRPVGLIFAGSPSFTVANSIIHINNYFQTSVVGRVPMSENDEIDTFGRHPMVRSAGEMRSTLEKEVESIGSYIEPTEDGICLVILKERVLQQDLLDYPKVVNGICVRLEEPGEIRIY